MIRIDLGTVPAHGTAGPQDTATTTIDGHSHVGRSRSAAVCALARVLVAAGVPDSPWAAYTTSGMASLRGRSIHRMAELTIEDTGHGLRWRKWRPYEGPPTSPPGSP